MDLPATLRANRHKTAISRPDNSRPIRTALADGLISKATCLLDYGCGLGDDVRHLRLRGVRADGWDPVHRPQEAISPTEIVNLGYVVNVIEDKGERGECLRRAWSLTERTLIVSARLASQTPDFRAIRPFGDGHVTSISTFQKLYEQVELKNWIDSVLGEQAVAAAPGVFYVFRDTGDRAAFLASRYRRGRNAKLPSLESLLEDHKELLAPLVMFFEQHGRAPWNDELEDAEPIVERFGSLRRALRLVERGHDQGDWRRTQNACGHDLLLFLALSRFEGRPRFGQLPSTIQRDIRALFGNYRRACEEADIALRAVGEFDRIKRAATRSAIGKLTPSAIYVHESALGALPPLLRLYEGCARRYVGRVEEANVIKLHVDEPRVSYLAYPDFETDPHPALETSLMVHLQTFDMRRRRYDRSKNPPILHRKETFITEDHPCHAKFARLTRIEEAKGLYAETTRIGTRSGWEAALAAAGLTLKGHRLVRRRTAA